MNVETFEIEEVGTDVAQEAIANGQAVELIERLGLGGQVKLLGDKKENLVRFPYPKMSEDQEKVLSVLTPKRTTLENYEDSLIPVRVLEAIERAKSCEGFINGGFMIWSENDAKQRDPVVVGIRKDKVPGQSWESSTNYLIARWGRELLPWEQLEAIAMKQWVSKIRGAYLKIKMETEQELKAIDIIEVTGDNRILGRMPSFYVAQ